MRKVNHAHVRNMKLRLSIRRALVVTRSLESGAKEAAEESSPVLSTSPEEWVRAVGPKRRSLT